MFETTYDDFSGFHKKKFVGNLISLLVRPSSEIFPPTNTNTCFRKKETQEVHLYRLVGLRLQR